MRKSWQKLFLDDPAFASRVLKVANSPYFCRGASVSSIDDAIFHVGFEAVSDIVMMSALKDLRRESDAVDFVLWEHSTAVAVASRSCDCHATWSRQSGRAFYSWIAP